MSENESQDIMLHYSNEWKGSARHEKIGLLSSLKSNNDNQLHHTPPYFHKNSD